MVVIGLSAIMIPALATALVATREGRVQESARLRAAALLNEGNEAAKIVRENSWNQFAINGTYHPVISGGTWTLASGAESSGGFTRSVQISDVQRDSSGAIVASGGTSDPSTKKVTSTVTFGSPIGVSLSNESYFSRFTSNAAWTQTTQADFNSGTRSSTSVTNTSGGEVALASGGAGITYVQSAAVGPQENYDFSQSASFAGNVTAGNAIIVAISWDTANAPVPSCSDNRGNTYGIAVTAEDTTMQQAAGICYALNVVGGTTTVTANYSTTAGYRHIIVTEYSGVALSDALDGTAGSAAVATTATDNVTSGSATTTMNNDLVFGAVMDTQDQSGILAGTGFAQRSFTSATNKFLAVQDLIKSTAGSVASTQTFANADRYAAVMAAFRPQHTTTVNWTPLTNVGNYDLPASTVDATDVFVDQDRAYVAIGTSLRVLSITNPARPVLIGSYTAPGAINDVFVKDRYAYIATAGNAAELVMVRLDNPSLPVAVATVDLPGTHDARTVSLANNKAYVSRVENATVGQNEFFVVNVPTPDSPSIAGSVNLTGSTNDSYASGDFVYLATANLTGDLTVINVSNSASPTVAGFYDAAGAGAGRGVFVIGTTVYFTKDQASEGPEFFIFNASNPASISVVGSYESGATLNSVWVDGNRAFLAGAISGSQLRTLDISNPAAPSVYSSITMSVTVNDVFKYGNYLFVASTSNTGELAAVRGAITYIPSGGGGGFATSGTFESASFNAGQQVAFNNLIAGANIPGGTNLRFQVAANTDNATWNFIGPDGTNATFYDTNDPLRLGTEGQYARLKAFFSGPGSSTPTLNDFSVNYSP